MSPKIRTSSDLRRALAAEVEIARALPAPDSSMAMAALANAITYSLEVELKIADTVLVGAWGTDLFDADKETDGKPDG